MDTEADTTEPVAPTAPAPPAQNSRTPWIVAAVATAVALVAVTVLITSAVVDDDRDRPRPLDARVVRAARFAPPFGGRVAGEITEIDGSSFEVNETKVTTDDDTKFRATTDGELGDLAVGDRIAVTGENTDGVITAARIVEAPGVLRHKGGRAIHPRGPGPMRGGEITKIEGDTITVSGSGGDSSTVKTTGDTEIVVNRDIALRDLDVGDNVMVRGIPSDDGVDAKEVVKTQ